MTHYRLYLLRENGHICGYEVFEAADDERAISKAEFLGGGPGKELWCEGRRIKQWRVQSEGLSPVP